MADSQRFVIDSNVLISRLLLPGSAPGHAVRKAMSAGQLLVSDASLEELAIVLSRSKFDRYVTIRDRQEFLRMVGLVSEHIPIFRTVDVCRDPKDNMILELAVNGAATVIITGDRDLLVLHTFDGIPICSPSEYLASRP